MEGKETTKSLRLMHRRCPVTTREARRAPIPLICFALFSFVLPFFNYYYLKKKQNQNQTALWGMLAADSKKRPQC